MMGCQMATLAVREAGNHGSPALGRALRTGKTGTCWAQGWVICQAETPASGPSQERVKLAGVLYMKWHQKKKMCRLAIEPCLILVQMTLSELSQPRLLH